MRRRTRHELFSADREHLHIRAVGVSGDILSAELCGAVHHCDFVSDNKLVQTDQIKPCFLRHDIYRCACRERGIEILHRRVKAERAVGGKVIVFGNVEPLAEGKAEVDEVAVLEHTALRLARRTRGVDKRKQRIGIRCGQRGIAVVGKIINLIDGNDHAVPAVYDRSELVVGDNNGSL